MSDIDIYQSMSLADLAKHVQVASTVLHRRINGIADPVALPTPKASDYAFLWDPRNQSSPPVPIVAPTPTVAAPVSVPAPVPAPVVVVNEPVPDTFQRPDLAHVSVCGGKRGCTICRYYLQEDETELPKTIDYFRLHVSGFDPELDYNEGRQLIKSICSKCMPSNTYIRDGYTFGSLTFKQHKTAANAQLALEKAGLTANFFRNRPSEEDDQDDNTHSDESKKE